MTKVLEAELLDVLQRGLDSLPITLSPAQQQALLEYLYLLQKWNRVYNLTAVRDLRDMVVKHLLDSLAIAPLIKGKRILDIGTGAGLPGIPLAICYSDKHFDLLDSNGKRITFLKHVATELSLKNVETQYSRIEAYQFSGRYDTILARAFGTLAAIWHNGAQLLLENGQVLAMKGIYPEEEVAALPKDVAVSHQSLTVPLLDSNRHVVVMRSQHKGNNCG